MNRSQSAFEPSASTQPSAYDIPCILRSVSDDNVNANASGKIMPVML